MAKGTRDAAAVKGLTIIALIYLPATVVSVSLLSGLSSIERLQTGRTSSRRNS